MSNDIVPSISSDVVAIPDSELCVLPKQLFVAYPGMSEDQVRFMQLLYDGSNPSPSYTEWLESSNQYFLSVNLSKLQEGYKMIEDLLSRHVAKKHDDMDIDETKAWNKEHSRISRMLDRRHKTLMDVWRELNKVVQAKLLREAPKKLLVTKIDVKPSDIANAISNAKNVLNVSSEVVKE